MYVIKKRNISLKEIGHRQKGHMHFISVNDNLTFQVFIERFLDDKMSSQDYFEIDLSTTVLSIQV